MVASCLCQRCWEGFPSWKLFADGGYRGAKFRNRVANVLPGLEIEIVKRPDHNEGFVVLPRRWIVERTIAWLCVQ